MGSFFRDLFLVKTFNPGKFWCKVDIYKNPLNSSAGVESQTTSSTHVYQSMVTANNRQHVYD